MVYINKNVYFVEGAINAALYDLNSGDIYQITQESKELIKKLIENPESSLNWEEKRYLSSLIELGLVTNHKVDNHDINDLIEKTNLEFVWIEITNMCNLKCVHCYDEASCDNGKIMTVDAYKHVIDELIGIGVKKIQIIGGEPFILGDKLIQYLDYCVGKFDYIEIFTNGTLINEKLMKYLKENNIRIALSVYSYIEDEHNKVTQNRDSWKKTNSTIKKLNEYKIMYKVKNVLMSDVKIGQRNTDLYELSFKRDIVRLTGRAKIELLSDDLLKKKLITENNFAYKISKKTISKNISGHNCFSRRLYISVDLDVFPCVMERRFMHGNIKDKHLFEILDEKIFQITKDEINECRSCELRYTCFDCRPDSNGRGKFDKPWYCTYLPLIGKWNTDYEEFIKNI